MEHIDDVRPRSGPVFWKKLVAWWYGYEAPSLGFLRAYKTSFLGWWNGEKEPAPFGNWGIDTSFSVRTTDAPHAKKQDVSARLVVLQALWGEGNITPGPADFITDQLLLLRLTPEMSMFDLGAGLGGPSRAINTAYGIWVTALEWDAEIAATGMEQSIMHGMGRKVPITHFDPGGVQKQMRKIDCFFSKDALHLVQEKKQLLLAIKAAFKKRGQFCIMDYVITAQGKDSPRITAWNAADEHVSYFWSKEEYAAAFSGMKLKLRVTEDMTAQYCAMITEGFRQLTHTMQELIESETDPVKKSDLHRALAYESNRWAVRAEAMHAGDIAFIRFSGDTG